MELMISRLLRAGILVSGALVLLGGIVALAETAGSASPALSSLDPSSRLPSLSGLLDGVASLNADALVQLGLVVLVATPAMRVAVSAYAFARQRDWTYVAISVTVLTVLAIGLVIGGG